MKVLPSPQAISRMEEALKWNRFLEPNDCHLMWARAEAALPRDVFAGVLGLINTLRGPPVTTVSI